MNITMVLERRKNKKRKDDGSVNFIIPDKPSKEEYAVAKWIRNNVQSKKTKFDRNHNVEYFTGTRVVDALIEKSPWASSLFINRQHVVDFLDTMLRHKFFHRAKKIIITEDELNRYKGLKKKNKDLKDLKKKSEITPDKVCSNSSEQKNHTEEDICSLPKEEPKKKSKVRLEMHTSQFFEDCNDAYVWIYEPIPMYYWFFGTLLVLGAIGVCLFPLWPLTVRHGVWYLSIIAAGFLVFILSLIIIRIIVFSFLWILTFGKHHLWLLPNLVEDVGFFASFWPLYQYQYYGSAADDTSDVQENKPNKKNLCTKENDKFELKTSFESSRQQSDSDSLKLTKSSKKENNQLSDRYHSSEESESEKSNSGDFELL